MFRVSFTGSLVAGLELTGVGSGGLDLSGSSKLGSKGCYAAHYLSQAIKGPMNDTIFCGSPQPLESASPTKVTNWVQHLAALAISFLTFSFWLPRQAHNSNWASAVHLRTLTGRSERERDVCDVSTMCANRHLSYPGELSRLLASGGLYLVEVKQVVAKRPADLFILLNYLYLAAPFERMFPFKCLDLQQTIASVLFYDNKRMEHFWTILRLLF